MPTLGMVFSIAGGDSGTIATVARMRLEARRGALTPTVREQAVRIVQGSGIDGTLHARLIREWVGAHTTFLPDPYHAEALHQPDYVVANILRQGVVSVDCDDVALLTAALGLSIGLRARYVLVGFVSPTFPLQHVWCELADARRGPWIPVDPTRPMQPLAHQRIRRRYVVGV